MGSLPSSRLTKILQEKAELLKKRRQTAEQVLHETEERIKLLEQIEIVLPESKEREARLKELARHADWEAVETQAKAFLEYLGAEAHVALEQRRREIAERGERLVRSGTPLPDEIRTLVADLAHPLSDGAWGATVEKLARLDAAVRGAETEFSVRSRSRAAQVAEWSGEHGERLQALDLKFRQALEPVRQGRLPEALARLNETLRAELPAAMERRRAAREAGTALVAAAKDLTVPSTGLEAALQADAEVDAIDWIEVVPAVEIASAKLADNLRERVAATIDSLRSTLASLRDQGVDPTANLATVEEALSQVPGAGPVELPNLLDRARAATEEPVVAIVAGLLDEVRPRLVEARRLGRDPSDVFAAMNRAREALRLKIYGEALAASQEAIDRVCRLTQELDTAQDELAGLRELLERLDAVKFRTEPFRASLTQAAAALDRFELDAARSFLRDTVRALGEEAIRFFGGRLATCEKVGTIAKDRGFLTANEEEELPRIRALIEAGQLAEAGEHLAGLEVRMRVAAQPYIARRVEEIAAGFADLPDDSLIAPVRRHLADTDVNLRVKEDLASSLESLRRAEREFSAVFAAHASALVEGLEDERKALEQMGGAGDEIQRQIDEVQQIFNMGDFVKASRASQEIRTRAHQQQLIRSEEAFSHAKLALVELGKMGLDTADLRTDLDAAQTAVHASHFPDAYGRATRVLTAASKLKADAQAVLDATAEATDLWQSLRAAGLPVDPLRSRISEAQAAYQALDFDAARAALTGLTTALEHERAGATARAKLSEADLLVEDAQRLGLPAESFAPRVAEVRDLMSHDRHAEAAERVGPLHADLILLLRPVLEDNLRTIERDLDVARSSGVESPEVVRTLGEARARLDLPVPTGVEEILERARSQLVETRGFVEHAERASKRAREALNEAELAHVDVAHDRTRMERVDALLGDKEYPRVIELAGALERNVHQATYQQVAKTLAGFQGMIVRARQEGAVTTLAENLLNQARTSLEDGKPLDALQLATRSETELERVDLQRQIAEASLDSIERKLQSTLKLGVRALLAEEEVRRARDGFDHQDFPLVLELAIEASDGLTVAREAHRKARDALDGADRQVKEALEVGADVGEVMRLVDAARASSEAGDYPEATRRAREAAEKARWAIERLYTGALGDTRALLDTARHYAPPESIASIADPLADAESALKTREWKRAGDLLAHARDTAHTTLDAHATALWHQVEQLYRTEAPTDTSEAEFRDQAKSHLASSRERQAYAEAFQLIGEETRRLQERRNSDLQKRVGALKEQVWVGERLGVDTTPVMELLSEAGLALDARRAGPVPDLLRRAEVKLGEQVASRLPDKTRDVQTELVFAQDGLHVTVGSVVDQLKTADDRARGGAPIEAARLVLLAEDELNRRKAMHRELLNIHYLIDAALGRASERKMDTAPARRLLDESIQVRATDYVVALEKARQSLALLQGQLKGAEPTTFWPFKRPSA
ncbi:MAG: hypothetical protein ACREDK_07715 [Thermoplasmata archaeon]